MKEALFYTKGDCLAVSCGLCRFRCHIAVGRRGGCGVRENRDGVLYSLVYGKSVVDHVDPVEKKPLFHMLPGSRSLSIATVGCNFRCRHCQNYAISQISVDDGAIVGAELSPEAIVDHAVSTGCRSISYTYTEPTVFFEYAYDTAVFAHRVGLKNIFVTNGYISRDALAYISPYLDAANIDLKAFSEGFYRNIVKASLAEVLDSLVEYKRLGVWIELTTLIIPGLNDSDKELTALARFIATELGCETPWHVSRFFPTYRLTDRPGTPLATLQRAGEIGRAAGLHYVYEGNVPGAGGETTWCPGCGKALIVRHGFAVIECSLHQGACPECGFPVAGIWL
jgi:pyruvate formate lyase activating enzyme